MYFFKEKNTFKINLLLNHSIKQFWKQVFKKYSENGISKLCSEYNPNRRVVTKFKFGSKFQNDIIDVKKKKKTGIIFFFRIAIQSMRFFLHAKNIHYFFSKLFAASAPPHFPCRACKRRTIFIRICLWDRTMHYRTRGLWRRRRDIGRYAFSFEDAFRLMYVNPSAFRIFHGFIRNY